jgi:hypothetical protein
MMKSPVENAAYHAGKNPAGKPAKSGGAPAAGATFLI